jgi:tRNA-2-methylthio-N6-dimethylallyladenosine synthase
MNPAKNRFFVETFGCQMNVNDSEKVAGLMFADGYESAASAEDADVVFVNTCAVREKAAEKLFHRLGRFKQLKAHKPDLVVAVGGCVAQLSGEAIRQRAPHVDVLVGTHNLASVPALVNRARAGEAGLAELDRRVDSFAVPPEAVAHSSAVRAFVTVMEGCNHVCSFCVVPRTRGPEVNRDPESIVAEVRSLVARGFREVMLLGQTVNAYRYGSLVFADLLERVHDVPGLRRLRFTTSHPAHVDERLARAFRDLPRLCPSLHLPVQSGSDRILRAMRRGYTSGEYRTAVAMLREHAPGLALSSDAIVGYPGESEADFERTVDLLDAVPFDGVYVFEYSARPGTTALREADDVPPAEKRRRFQVLNEAQQRRQRARNAARIGEVEEVLGEAVGREGWLWGRTRDFRIVHFEAPADLLGLAERVRIVGAGANSLTGRLLASDSLTGGSGAPIFRPGPEGAWKSR